MPLAQSESSGNPSHSVGDRKVIYDFGANNGDDIPYYLKKADRVIAIEANPSLCAEIATRFAADISKGRVFVENCVVAAEGCAPAVDFFLHKRHHVLGQLAQPDPTVAGDFTQVTLPTQTVSHILQKHGEPYYIKIDIEGFDDVLLEELFRNGVTPPYISAESQSVRVFALLAGLGGYASFKLVDGKTVEKKFKNHLIQVGDKWERYSFPAHAAGPFGDDIPGDWMNAEDLFYSIAEAGLGWKDIHATRLVTVDPTSKGRKRRQILRHFRGWLRARRGERNQA